MLGHQDRNRVIVELSSELLFAVLPLIVVLLVFISRDAPGKVWSSAEWSFAAAILFGQTVVRFTAGMSRGGAATAPVALTTTVLIVLGLVPALLILTLTLLANEAGTAPALWLKVTQILMFIGAAIAYLVLGTVGALWTKSRVETRPDAVRTPNQKAR
jgi:hypothetical protein